MRGKIKSFREIKKISRQLKKEGRKIIFTNGCFDILHKGHIRLLKKAKSLGEVLIVGLNTDSSVRRLKGEDRPFFKQDERAEILSSLEMVDYIVLFPQDTPYKLIETIKPDILVKGGDYRKDGVVGRDIVESYGGKVYIFPVVKGVSTTKIVEKIKKAEK
ncbi:MAG: D-glycero-beta-D-manno-heptose 1-phosphate adenylyltransferase [Candidatus Omnitrophica bacterium]|nr:D-glycero-beta-D-manno-heptose 1-phosphate adenylyltransferase [Candidatus Omnitrophota bacterium]